MADFIKNNSKESVKDYTWKLGKIKGENGVIYQDSIKLIDATEEQLRSFASHCNSMLYNTNNEQHPGRYVLLEIIKKQINKCNAELFRRHLGDSYSNIVLKSLIDFVNINDGGNLSNVSLRQSNILDENQAADPEFGMVEYLDLPIFDVIDGLKKKLGQFDKKHLTLTFLLQQGIWFSKEEKQDFDTYMNEFPESNKIDYVKSVLKLDNVRIKINPKGLTLNEMKSMISISNKSLYMDMSSDQLLLLRNRVLYELADEAKFHIKEWELRIKQIKEVAKINGYKL